MRSDSLVNGDSFRAPPLFKIATLVFVSVTFFYFGKHWFDGYQQLIFFQSTSQAPTVSLSPNYNKHFNISTLIQQNDTQTLPDKTLNLDPTPSPLLAPNPPPPSDSVQRFGIVDENGTMSDQFEVGDLDPEYVENRGNSTEVDNGEGGSRSFRIKKFALCPQNMSEYIPCLDNVDAISKLKSVEKGEKFERHCPVAGGGFNCLIPPPKGYQTPIPWPRSRDQVLLALYFQLQKLNDLKLLQLIKSCFFCESILEFS